MQVIFTVNGPGEIMGWLHPLSAALRARHPQIGIHVCILPCVFSTGAEKHVVESLRTIDTVLGVAESLSLIFRGIRPAALRLDGPVLVFHLGGEIALSHLLGLRLKAPRYGYVENHAPLNRLFRKVFHNGLTLRHGEAPGGTLGELMVDAARLRQSLAARPVRNTPTIALFPGSRAYLMIHALPYFAVQVDRLSARFPGLEWLLAQSGFVPMETLRTLPPPLAGRRWQAVALRFHEDDTGAWFETEGGNRISILSGPEAIARADFALTIPGTNTGELAASGVPMVVALPTYIGDQVPLPGLPGHLARIPLIGKSLKMVLGWRFLRNMGFLAQPNLRAGRQLVPEFVGEGLHDGMEAAMAEFIAGFGQDAALRAALRDTMGQPGAAEALTTEIAAFFGQTARPDTANAAPQPQDPPQTEAPPREAAPQEAQA